MSQPINDEWMTIGPKKVQKKKKVVNLMTKIIVKKKGWNLEKCVEIICATIRQNGGHFFPIFFEDDEKHHASKTQEVMDFVRPIFEKLVEQGLGLNVWMPLPRIKKENKDHVEYGLCVIYDMSKVGDRIYLPNRNRCVFWHIHGESGENDFSFVRKVSQAVEETSVPVVETPVHVLETLNTLEEPEQVVQTSVPVVETPNPVVETPDHQNKIEKVNTDVDFARLVLAIKNSPGENVKKAEAMSYVVDLFLGSS